MSRRVQYDRETIFQLLQKQDWNGLIELFKNNDIYAEIQNDPIARDIIDREFINELISGSSFQDNIDYLSYLEDFYVLHVDDRNFRFKLPNDNLNQLVGKIVSIYWGKQNKAAALRYANRFPELAVCREVIEAHQRTQPKMVVHSQSATIAVSENKEIEEIDATTSLFKSNLEYDFYAAVRGVYSSFMVFPNVALSALIDFNKIQHLLSQPEKTYFFTGLVDCVVFDQANFYKPLVMIEVDSIYHDTEAQKTKDLMKDNIIAKAGKKLYRVRNAENYKPEQSELIQLIREAVK